MLAALARRGLQPLPAASRLAAISSSASAARGDKKATSDPADEFIFREHCKGERHVSKDAEEVKERLRRSDFGAPRRAPKPAAAAAAATSQGAGAAAGAASSQHQLGLHSASWAAAGEQRSADDAAQEIVEKGSKKLMQTDDGREELRQGSFDLDKTTERIAEEGKKDASPEAAARAEDKDVKNSVRSRVVSGSQTT